MKSIVTRLMQINSQQATKQSPFSDFAANVVQGDCFAESVKPSLVSSWSPLTEARNDERGRVCSRGGGCQWI